MILMLIWLALVTVVADTDGGANGDGGGGKCRMTPGGGGKCRMAAQRGFGSGSQLQNLGSVGPETRNLFQL